VNRIILHDGSPGTKHLMSSCDIQVAPGGREASTLTYVLVLQATSQLPLQLIRATRVHDKFVRDTGGWHLAERDETVGRRDGNLTQHLRT
jgi:hypothetical protein